MPSDSSDRRLQDLEEAALQRIEVLMVSSSPKQAIRSTAPAAPEVAGERAGADGPDDSIKPH